VSSMFAPVPSVVVIVVIVVIAAAAVITSIQDIKLIFQDNR
jgi:hypothetical protein